MEVAFVNFQYASQDKNDGQKLSQSAFTYFDEINKEIFEASLKVSNLTVKNIVVSCAAAFSVSYFVLANIFESDLKTVNRADWQSSR